MPKSPEGMFAAIARNLPDKTGRSLEEWMEVAKDAPEGKKTERISWLKAQGLGHGQAQTVLHFLEGPTVDYADQSGLIDALFKGRHTDLRPVFEDLRDIVSTRWDDVEVSARKTYVSFNRNKQFLIVLPKGGELVLGFALPPDYEDERMTVAKNVGGSDRIRWKVALQDATELPSVMDLVEAAHDVN
jgi:predicted transport protein